MLVYFPKELSNIVQILSSITCVDDIGLSFEMSVRCELYCKPHMLMLNSVCSRRAHTIDGGASACVCQYVSFACSYPDSRMQLTSVEDGKSSGPVRSGVRQVRDCVQINESMA